MNWTEGNYLGLLFLLFRFFFFNLILIQPQTDKLSCRKKSDTANQNGCFFSPRNESKKSLPPLLEIFAKKNSELSDSEKKIQNLFINEQNHWVIDFICAQRFTFLVAFPLLKDKCKNTNNFYKEIVIYLLTYCLLLIMLAK